MKFFWENQNMNMGYSLIFVLFLSLAGCVQQTNEAPYSWQDAFSNYIKNQDFEGAYIVIEGQYYVGHKIPNLNIDEKTTHKLLEGGYSTLKKNIKSTFNNNSIYLLDKETQNIIYNTITKRINIFKTLGGSNEKANALLTQFRKHKDKPKQILEMLENIDSVKQNSIVHCSGELKCKRLFSLAQIFINDNASKKIQLATDTIIETYNPTEEGEIFMRAIKTPVNDSDYEITLDVVCKGMTLDLVSLMNDKHDCLEKITKIYEGFPKFLKGKK